MKRILSIFLWFFLAELGMALAQLPTAPLRNQEAIATHHLVVIYRNNIIPANADAIAATVNARARHLPLFGLSSLQISGDDTLAIARLRSQPEVATVLHDRYVTGHTLLIRSTNIVSPPTPSTVAPQQNNRRNISVAPNPPVNAPISIGHLDPIISYPRPQPPPTPAAALGWAQLQSGGYGDDLPGGPTTGPWNITRGAGVRIAVLDTGVDATHPAIAPNLILNLSEVIPSALPTPCDTGDPTDQLGHGTWVASLAAGALNTPSTGVAPQASILNIKVLQRMPSSDGATIPARCAAGQSGGLLSWVLQGIQDAILNHADIAVLSLGTLVDITTGDGAGWQAQFNRVTYAATQAGTILVAALGNDALDLSPGSQALTSGQFIELPAQSRSVLPVVASTNPACAEDLSPATTCTPGPITRPYYSNHGATGSIAAPGGSYPEGPTPGPTTSPTGWIYGACAGSDIYGCFNAGHVQYIQAIGTSASAALVAGAAALLHAAQPNWTATQIITALQTTATPTSSLPEPLLNLPTALTLQQ